MPLAARWAVLCALAFLPGLAGAQTITISNLWKISTAEARPYLTNSTSNSYWERGVAYNPLNNHAYIVSRFAPLKVAILDGDTGAELGFLNVSGISGGTFALSTISVSADGSIYAANLTTGSATSPYKIYRWADESSAPAAVFSGNPSVGAYNNCYGESFDARGSGIDTEIIASANGAAIIAIFKPTDDTLSTFTSTRLDVSGLTAAGDLTKGIAFGPTNTFFGKNSGVTRVAFCSYSLGAGAATLLTNYTALSGIGPIDVDSANNLLAGVESSTTPSPPHNLRVYDLSGGSAALIFTTAFPPPATNNGNIVGEVQISGDRILAIDTQNGVVMAKIYVDTNLAPPTITQQPTNQTVVQGGYTSGSTSFSVGASGTKPLGYQWFINQTNAIPDATNTTYTVNLTNITLADAATYSVTVSNVVGLTNSDAGVLTVTPTALTMIMTQCWQQAVGSTFYLVNDGTQRGLAYNPNPADPANPRLIVVSRTPTNGIHVLDANTGVYLWSMDLTGISGGTFAIDMVGCTDDGEVFVANLTTGGMTVPFKIYGYVNDGPATQAYLAWSGDPGHGTNNQRWGDSFDVRGSGGVVQIIAGSRFAKAVSFYQGFAGSGLLDSLIDVAEAENGNFGLSIAFGEGDTFWGKSSATALRQVAFDINTGMGTVLRTITNYPTMTVVGYDPINKLLAGISLETPDNIRLLNGDGLSDTGFERDTEFFPSDNANANGTGSVRFGKGKLFALDSNNGILALSVWPKLRLSRSGSVVTLTWDGTHTLQATPDLGVPFTNVVGAVSGYMVDTASGDTLLYRLKD